MFKQTDLGDNFSVYCLKLIEVARFNLDMLQYLFAKTEQIGVLRFPNNRKTRYETVTMVTGLST